MKASEDTKKRKVEATTHISVFLAVFCVSSAVLKNSIAANNVTLLDFIIPKEQTWADFTYYWFKRAFYVGSMNDVLKLLVRAVLSSFAKDGIISIWSPKKYTNKVPIKLTEKVMGKAFDPAWIPKSDKDRHMETKLGRPVSQNIFYSQIKPLMNLVIFICSKVNLLLILFTELANHVTNFIVTTSLGMISFTVRSLITAISLALLVPIHIGQTVLRVIRCIHGITMGFVRTSSKMVNDIGMLNVDLIKESYVYEAGEQMEKLEQEQKFVRKSMMNIMSSNPGLLAPSTGTMSSQGLDRARNYVPSSDAVSE